MPNRGIKGKKLIYLLSAILLTSFILITINIRTGKTGVLPESLLIWIVSPFQSLFTRTVDSVSSTIDHYFFLVGVSRENAGLLKEIDGLKGEVNRLEELIRKEGRVAELLEQEILHEHKFLMASVIGRDATQWSKMVLIDKGTKDGVHENLSVVTGSGTVGHIIHATSSVSKVLLIIDSRSAVDSIFQDSRIPGVTVGTGKGNCDLKYVPISAEIKVGDKVISSGLGGIFPKGLLVGTVSQITKKKRGLFQDITLVPSADLTRLEEVMVLLS